MIRAPMTMVQYWEKRVRHLRDAGDHQGASALADLILDEIFPKRWKD